MKIEIKEILIINTLTCSTILQDRGEYAPLKT